MMSSALAAWQSNNNYRREGDVVYGVFQGCGFAVSEEDGGKLFTFMLSARDNHSFDDFENALASQGGELALAQVGDVENYLAVFFDESAGTISPNTMSDVLQFTASQARACGFRVPNTCVKCGARATKRSFVDNMVQPLCADCSAQLKQQRRSAPTPPPASPMPPAPAPSPIAAPITAPEPMVSQDDQYARQYAPLVPDSSKYDETYDEYSGMAPQYGGNDTYSDPFGGTYNDSDYSQPPISFDDSGDEYRDIMGDGSDTSSNVTKVEGSIGAGILGAMLGSVIGVIPYMVIAILADFHMAALCFPAGMLAVVFYTILGGRKAKALGMSICMVVSAIVSEILMFLGMVFSYVNDTTNFSQALNYLFTEQSTFFTVNVIFSVLGAIFGAFFMISVMSKYVGEKEE